MAMTHHFRDDSNQHRWEGGTWVGPDFSTGFHEFAVEWLPDHITWYIDGVEHFRSDKSIPRQKMYLLLNLAIGGSWPGAPDEKTIFPTAFDIDYIRVYKKLP